ncbi:DNA polymerase III subunit alpha [Pacificimonas sp. WHA3]|uniref:DNA polymerase III subunit alpha n=1 Tax=Pacificimonas pallii TaxID=2827236 RepID=A0ABS6SDV9_9SPHN|nr:DNA polymerase III subunit alpha [Pacificimonas pallii]MBV7256564.1 DNA polymerase III subunit alpha [Pacificimonas pallii]
MPETPAATPYVPLRIQSAYSMLEGAMYPATIAEICVAGGMPAAALTDRDVLFGAMDFSQGLRAKGVQPIIGTMLSVERPGGRRIGSRPVIDSVVVLAQNEEGYANLIALISAAHLGSEPADGPHVTLDELEARSNGLIALTGGADGAVARLLAEGQAAAAEAYLDELSGMFGDRLYIEIARTGEKVELLSEAALIELAHARELPLVATNPACFPEEAFSPAHDAMLCIANTSYLETQDRRRSNPGCWLKPAKEMRRTFADLPEALENTAVIARRCAVMAPERDPILPSLAGDLDGEVQELRRLAREGLARRLERDPEADTKIYEDRLEYELGIIEGMGFPGYFLIVADFIQWAKGEDIPVGPGRGSGAGSVVAWSLTITDLDPIKLGLLFERFLNPQRVSMPDFDIDFCETRRGEVIRYVQQKYGHGQVAQIITFGKLKARAVIKDVGRVLQMPYGQIDRLAKMIDNNPANPQDLKTALDENPDLRRERKQDRQVRKLIDLALKLEGMPRHSSTHAAGVVIGDRPLAELVPLYRDPRSDMQVTQFDMKYVEQAGLVKFDFLGLKTLSVLQRALSLIKETTGETVDLSAITWDDPDVYALITRGDTAGVFQLESPGMRSALAQVKPDKFEDIIALVSLYRPGPMDNIPQFARRKHGQEDPDYLHPRLEQYLTETYGVIIYQEQVMQVAQELAGYSLGEADLLRRAMGKKKKEEMDAQRVRFLSGAKERGVEERQAGGIFDLVAKFAGYGFNKSHAAAYALVSYQTAWVKSHYPTEFYAATMAFDLALTDKLAVFLEDARRLGIQCLPPDINASGADFTVEVGEDGVRRVRWALAALKSVGLKAMQGIETERKENGPFKSLGDFANRVDPQLLNKRQIEQLVGAGAFDSLEPNRAAALAMAESILAAANSAAEARRTNQGALFGGDSGGGGEIALMAPKNVEKWSLAETMSHERDAFGFFFSAHPLSAWQHVLDDKHARTFMQLCERGGPADGKEMATMGAMVDSVRWRTAQKSGRKYIFATLSDQGGQYFASAFDEDMQEVLQEAARSGECLLLKVELRWGGDEGPRIAVRGATPLSDLGGGGRATIDIELTDMRSIDLLSPLFAAEEGNGIACINVPLAGGGRAQMKLKSGMNVDSELAHRIADLPGVASAQLRI